MNPLDPNTIVFITERVVDSVEDVVSGMVFQHVDGTNSIAVIAELSGLEQHLVSKIAVDLAKKGRVSIPGFEEEGDETGQKKVKPTSDINEVKIKKSDFAIEVGEIFEATETANYYGCLGAGIADSRKELRTKYFALSKRFHPDRASGKDKVQAEVKHQMEVVFARLTQAYDVLSKANKRAVYDEENSDELEMYSIERKLRLAMTHPVNETTTEKPSDPPAKKKKASAAINPVRAKRKAAKVARTPRSVVHTIKPVPSSRGLSKQPKAPSRDKTPKKKNSSSNDKQTLDERRAEMKRQRASRAMASMFKQNPPSQTVAKQSKQQLSTVDRISAAELALEQHRPSDAANIIDEVLKKEPGNAKAKDVFDRAKLGQMQFKAREHISSGKNECRAKNYRGACKLFELAITCDKRNLDAKHLLAEALIESKGDISHATSLAKEVIVLGGQRARYFATLGELMLLAKDSRNAKKAFLRALELEPVNKEYKKRLKVCGR
jgi:curved DNA-binding protein CbpA